MTLISIVLLVIGAYLFSDIVIDIYIYIFGKVQLYRGIYLWIETILYVGCVYVGYIEKLLWYIVGVTIIAGIVGFLIGRKMTKKINENIIWFCHAIRSATTSEDVKEGPKIDWDEVFSE